MKTTGKFKNDSIYKVQLEKNYLLIKNTIEKWVHIQTYTENKSKFHKKNGWKLIKKYWIFSTSI